MALYAYSSPYRPQLLERSKFKVTEITGNWCERNELCDAWKDTSHGGEFCQYVRWIYKTTRRITRHLNLHN